METEAVAVETVGMMAAEEAVYGCVVRGCVVRGCAVRGCVGVRAVRMVRMVRMVRVVGVAVLAFCDGRCGVAGACPGSVSHCVGQLLRNRGRL